MAEEWVRGNDRRLREWRQMKIFCRRPSREDARGEDGWAATLGRFWGTPNLWDMERAGLAERGDARGARSAVTAHLTRHAMEDFLCL